MLKAEDAWAFRCDMTAELGAGSAGPCRTLERRPSSDGGAAARSRWGPFRSGHGHLLAATPRPHTWAPDALGALEGARKEPGEVRAHPNAGNNASD